jgi:hypothetical protein
MQELLTTVCLLTGSLQRSSFDTHIVYIDIQIKFLFLEVLILEVEGRGVVGDFIILLSLGIAIHSSDRTYRAVYILISRQDYLHPLGLVLTLYKCNRSPFVILLIYTSKLDTLSFLDIPQQIVAFRSREKRALSIHPLKVQEEEKDQHEQRDC